MNSKKCLACGGTIIQKYGESKNVFKIKKYCSQKCNGSTRKMRDISGKKYGKLTVIKFISKKIIKYKNSTGVRYFWMFKCDCGKEYTCNKNDVIFGKTISCGCVRKTGNNVKHRMSNDRFTKIWYGIVKRCTNINTTSAHRYVLRGIKNEWKSFDEFKHDMYESYLTHVLQFGEKETTIDRINNDGNYSFNNCKWSTYKEQANNTIKTSHQ